MLIPFKHNLKTCILSSKRDYMMPLEKYQLFYCKKVKTDKNRKHNSVYHSTFAVVRNEFKMYNARILLLESSKKLPLQRTSNFNNPWLPMHKSS